MEGASHRVASFGYDGELVEFAELGDAAAARRVGRKASKLPGVAYATVTDGATMLVYARGKNRLRLLAPGSRRPATTGELLRLPAGEGSEAVELPLADALRSRQQLLLERRTSGTLPDRDAALLTRLEAALRARGTNDEGHRP
ncbi:MAG: hypothetical protein JWM98_1407 [Thermoleophilia bacterium]|nr:hypothetical protein [Thermoleophilia bacterium]